MALILLQVVQTADVFGVNKSAQEVLQPHKRQEAHRRRAGGAQEAQEVSGRYKRRGGA